MFSAACLFLVLTLISSSHQVPSDGNKVRSENLQRDDYFYSHPVPSPEDADDLPNILLLKDTPSDEVRKSFLHQIHHSLWMVMKQGDGNVQDGFRVKRIFGAFTRTMPSRYTKTNPKPVYNDYFNNLFQGRFGFFSHSSERPRPLRWG